MSGWNRQGEMPHTQRVFITIDSAKHPDLARFVWELPYRSVSRELRDMLIKSLRDKPVDDPIKELAAHLERATELIALIGATGQVAQVPPAADPSPQAQPTHASAVAPAAAPAAAPAEQITPAARSLAGMF